jgi:hypothetical protein
MKECEGCFNEEDCVIIFQKENHRCPCRECIVKTTCNNNFCAEANKLILEIKDTIALGYI